jgi:SHS2 domain-containing protein
MPWENFAHGADIGVRGSGRTRAEAFGNAALALTAVLVEPGAVEARDCVPIRCSAPDDEMLLVDWLNAVVYAMATRNMLFGRFDVRLDDHTLAASAWGEAIDRARHQPAVEVKGATYTGLSVRERDDGWVAECVVDV